MSDGTLYHLNISWALPVVWPGSVYSLEIGVVGTDGVLTVDDTHRDVVLATTIRGVHAWPGEGRTDRGRLPDGAVLSSLR